MLKKFIAEFMMNGKGATVWIINELGLTGYPGIADALSNFMTSPTTANFWLLMFQCLWAGAAGHRLLKIAAKLLGNKLGAF